MRRRELVHTFRQKTLVLVKALILQKRVCVIPSMSCIINARLLSLANVLRLSCRKTLYFSIFSGLVITRSVELFVSILNIFDAVILIGLLQTLDDCGSPPLAARAPTLSRPTSLRTSDRRSMMAFMGLPLDIFGKVVSSQLFCFTSLTVDRMHGSNPISRFNSSRF